MGMGANGLQGLEQVAGDCVTEHRQVPIGAFQVGGAGGQGLMGTEQFVLQLDEAPTGVEADSQFAGLERLGNVVVRSGFHAGDEIFLPALRSEKDDVGVGLRHLLPEAAADLHPLQPRHPPVENGQPRCFFALQRLPCFVTVPGNDHLVAPVGQYLFQQVAKSRLVFGNQNLHEWASGNSS